MSATPVSPRLVQLLDLLGVDAGDCLRTDGRCSVPYKGGRLDILPLTGKRAILETLVVYLPTESEPRRACIVQALRFAAAQMQARPDVLAQSQEQDALVLQHEFGLDMSVPEMATVVEHFLHAADIWRRICDKT